ncbi:MAG: glycosyltransferase [Lentisphaerae bacterium]|nr:glycosyltransferase [Lentisphaerota bacterium]
MNERIRFLGIISNLSGGGAERVFANLLESLPRERFEVQLALWRRDADYEIPPGIPVHVLEKHRPWHVFRTIGRTARLIEELQPDIVFTTLYYTNIVTGEALRRVGRRPRWVCRFGNPPERQMRGLMRTWARRALRVADRVIGNSKGVTRALISHLGLEEERVQTIPNFVDVEQVEGLSRESPPFEADPGTFTVVHAGRFHRQKNQELLLRAFAGLGDLKAELWMLGKGELGEALRQEADDLGIGDKVRWCGFRKNPYPLFRSADCFVLSSDWEGLPNTLIEAMLCGTAVVSTRCDYGPEEIVEDGVNGLLVPVGDAAALTAALRKLAADPDLRRSMAERGRQTAVSSFNRGPRLAEYLSLFESLAGGEGEGK